jgi:hypothetical protein
MKMPSKKKYAMGGLAFLFAGMLIGCEPKGPAERAGEKIDNAGKNLKDAVDPRGPAAKAGDAIDKAVGNR